MIQKTTKDEHRYIIQPSVDGDRRYYNGVSSDRHIIQPNVNYDRRYYNTVLVVTGDFHIDLLKVEHKPKTKDSLDSIMTQGFSPK